MTAVDEEATLLREDIKEYLARHERKELLRFVVVGSVDDGKSTLIGRLLHDSDNVFEDQLSAVRKASTQVGQEIDFSLFTDGLKAEREQGITIDVAYRYFSTPNRKFIIADTPGHVQYTRNMATGASTANAGVILIDARLGVLQQSRRHAYIASLLGIPHLIVAINKMDLKDYDQEVFRQITDDFTRFAERLNFKDIAFIPISALKGDNIVEQSPNTPWYDGKTVLEHLETVPIAHDRNLADFRYPVQYVLRPDLTYRGFAGQIASGEVKKGDAVTVLPSRVQSKITAIDTFHGEIDHAFAPMSVTLRLESEVDVSRGDMIVPSDNLPKVGRRFDGVVVWMAERPLDPQKTYLLKHTTQVSRVDIRDVRWKMDMDTLEHVSAKRLELNDIGRLALDTHRPLFFDPYTRNRTTGAFILVDSLTNNTVAAGMIQPAETGVSEPTEAPQGPRTQVSPGERRERLGQSGATIWLTGLPGAGKTKLAFALERRLFDVGRVATVVDPDAMGLEPLTAEGKTPEVVGELARKLSDAGLLTICAFPAPRRSDRDAVRQHVGGGRFIEVHVEGAAADDAEHAFEAPEQPAVSLSLSDKEAENAAEAIVHALQERDLFDEL